MTLEKPLYKGVAGSPTTTLTAQYLVGTSTEISVADVSKLPVAPNLATITRRDRTFVTIQYTTISGNTLQGITVKDGATTGVFPIESAVARVYTYQDDDAIKDDIADLDEAVVAAQRDIDTHTADHNNPHGVTKAQVGLGNTTDGAQINVLEDVKVNGTSLTKTNKAVNIPLATITTPGVVTVGSGLVVNNGKVSVESSPGYFQFDMSLSSPGNITYGGKFSNMNQSDRGGWFNNRASLWTVLNGAENYELSKTDWSKKLDGTAANTDGTDGDLMLRLSTIWTKHELIPSTNGGRIFRCYISDLPYAGLTPKAHRYGDEIKPYLYVGMFKAPNGSTTELKSYYSTTETPLVSETIDAFRGLATAKVATGGGHYGLVNYNTHTLITDLILFVYGDRNLQTKVGRGICDTNAAKATTGITTTGGMTQGNTTSGSNVSVVLLWLVDWYADVWEWRDGIMHSSGTFKQSVKNNDMATLTNGYANLPASWQVTATGITTEASWKYIKEVCGQDNAPYLPTVAGAAGTSDATYFTDAVYSNTGERVCRVGGDWDNAGRCGAFCVSLSAGASAASSAVGARLQMLSA